MALNDPVSPESYVAAETRKSDAFYSRLKVRTSKGSCPYGVPGGDHSFVCGPALYTRPYNMTQAKVAELVLFATANDLSFDFDGTYTPTEGTMGIKLWNPKRQDLFRDAAKSRGSVYWSEVEAVISNRLDSEDY